MYGHLNNAIYYQLFDTAINGWLIGDAGIDPITAPVQGVVVESGCSYFRSVGFPEPLSIGLAVARLGTSSVTYSLGVFADDEPTVAAAGRWVHVYVDAQTRRPVPVPEALRAVMATAVVTTEGDQS
ncbi:acyl-CoA thioesterase [Williamsia sp. CHRR-6]|nr:acyl-CoA thioesterase [Williamsia sp. CHRR-6]